MSVNQSVISFVVLFILQVAAVQPESTPHSLTSSMTNAESSILPSTLSSSDVSDTDITMETNTQSFPAVTVETKLDEDDHQISEPMTIPLVLALVFASLSVMIISAIIALLLCNKTKPQKPLEAYRHSQSFDYVLEIYPHFLRQESLIAMPDKDSSNTPVITHGVAPPRDQCLQGERTPPPPYYMSCMNRFQSSVIGEPVERPSAEGDSEETYEPIWEARVEEEANETSHDLYTVVEDENEYSITL